MARPGTPASPAQAARCRINSRPSARHTGLISEADAAGPSAGAFAVYLAVLESRQAAAGDSRDPHDRVVIVEFLCLAGPPLFACASI